MVKTEKMHEAMLYQFIDPVIYQTVVSCTLLNYFRITKNNITQVQLVWRLHCQFTFCLGKRQNICRSIDISVLFIKSLHFSIPNNRNAHLNGAFDLLLKQSLYNSLFDFLAIDLVSALHVNRDGYRIHTLEN